MIKWKPATMALRTRRPCSQAFLAEWIRRVLAVEVVASVLEAWLSMMAERKWRPE